MRWKLWLVTLIAVGALTACDNGSTARLYVAPHPVIPNHYAVTLLDPQFYDDPASIHAAINSYGQVAGRLPGNNLKHSVFLWTPTSPNGNKGIFVDYSPIILGYNLSFFGLNDEGQVFGVDDTGNFLWTPKQPNSMVGSITYLRLPGKLGDISAFNGDGQIIFNPNAISGASTLPSLWTPDAPNGATGTAVTINKLNAADTRLTLVALNNQGQIAGTEAEQGGAQHVTLWTPQHANSADGALVDLGVPVNNTQAIVTGLSNSGAIIGASYYHTPDVSNLAYVWVPSKAHSATGTFTTLVPLPHDAYMAPQAVNSSLLVAGLSWSKPLYKHAFLWDPAHGTRDLTAMLTGPTIVDLDPLSINDDGQILAIGVAPDGYEHFIVLSPQA